MNQSFRKVSALLALLLATSLTFAHAPDHSYLILRIYKNAIGGRVELMAKDINKAIGSNINDELNMEELQRVLPQLYKYIQENTSFGSGTESYTLRFTEPEILDLEEEEVDDYVRLNFELDGVSQVPESLDLEYGLIFDKERKHRAPLIVEYNFKAGVVNNYGSMSDIFEPGKRKVQLSLTDTSVWKGFVALVRLGVWHIWIGLDHILFILALILPSVVRRQTLDSGDKKWVWTPVEKFKPAFLYILKVITFFTLAHSITLAIAALGLINLPSHIVEAIIALSIALAAYHNITPIFKSKEWLIAFGFGLFHGFGFASVLGEKGLGGDYMITSLLGFNIGVEIGQVIIICMIFPFLFLLRRLKIYPPFIKYGSMVLILISIYWFIERAFEVDLPAGAYFWKAFNAIFG